MKARIAWSLAALISTAAGFAWAQGSPTAAPTTDPGPARDDKSGGHGTVRKDEGKKGGKPDPKADDKKSPVKVSDMSRMPFNSARRV